MGNEESKSWVFQNVLFLDPNAPPFISQEEYDRRQAALAAGEEFDPFSANQTSEQRGVRRNVPAQTKLRTRVFRVLVDINGRSSEFQLKCDNNPLALVVMNRDGKVLRSLPTGFVRKMERRGTTVKCQFGTNTNENIDDDQIFISFQFDDLNETQAFIDSVKLLYGIFVEEYGVTKSEARQIKKRDAMKTKVCSVHGNVPCNCERNGGRQIKVDDERYQQLRASTDYPVTIRGKLESVFFPGGLHASIKIYADGNYVSIAGSILKWADISVIGKSHPPKAVEWRVSYIPGGEPEFTIEDPTSTATPSDWNVVMDDSLYITDGMVGKFIEVKVIRRVKDASQHLPVVYSLARKGPVTFNDAGARDILKIIVQPAYTISIELSPEDALLLTTTSEQRIKAFATRQPFLDGTLTLTRQGIQIWVASVMSEPFDVIWSQFYVTCLESAQSDLGEEEDLYIQIHLKRSKRKQVVIRLATSSEKERNCVYHAICFFKLEKSFKGFDRWIIDLDRGNFAVFKQRYAKLWESKSFYDDVVDGTDVHTDIANRYQFLKDTGRLERQESYKQDKEEQFQNEASRTRWQTSKSPKASKTQESWNPVSGLRIPDSQSQTGTQKLYRRSFAADEEEYQEDYQEE